MSDRGHRADDGAWQWTVIKEGGEELTVRHFAPDIIEHYYQPQGHNEPITLYTGRFCMPESDPDELAYAGDVRLAWLPTPKVVASGERGPSGTSFDGLQEWSSRSRSSAWVLIPTLRLPEATGFPESLNDGVPKSIASTFTVQMTEAVYPPELGDGSALTHLTGLLPNGFDVWTGWPIVDPADRRWLRHVRTVACGGGWEVTLDAVNGDLGVWESLRGNGGYRVTQIMSMRRARRTSFTADEAKAALHAVRCALALALGRHTEVVLPVGWQSDKPVWTRWTAGQVDSYRDPGTWLDSSITARQVGEVIGRFLDSWADELRRDTLFYTTGYYVQALGRQAETGITSAISGLLLLGLSWFVEERGFYSRGAWEDLGIEGQIRTMLESAFCRVDTSVPAGFNYLASVAKQLRAQAGPQKSHYDGLSCLVKMRHEILHPTRKRRVRWTYQELVEAYLLVVHFFEVAMLAYIGYRGKYHPRISANNFSGYVEDVPWLGC